MDCRDTGRGELGRIGERLARKHLENNGFLVLHCNWRSGHRELDIVAEKEDCIHFVEVRSRREPVMVEPAQTVTRDKQLTLMSAARAYMSRFRLDLEVQFDVIAIVFGPKGPDDLQYKLEYIPDAFSPIS